MNRPQSHIVSLLVIAALVLIASNGRAQPRTIDTALEKRAIFVDRQRKLWPWPPAAAPRAGAPWTIRILGNDPFQQGEVNHLGRRLADVKNVRVIRFANVAAFAPCHILVVSQAGDLQPALVRTQGQPVLVIAQAPGLAKQGAVLDLPVVQNKVKMEINLSAAKKAGLTPNPGLLRIAEIIQ